MTTATLAAPPREEALLVRRTHLGIGLAIVGLVAMDSMMLFATTTNRGHFRHAADWVLTAAAIPQGIGLVMATLGVHQLQAGRDGRLGRIGVWVYAACMTELVVQCIVGLIQGQETEWGPLYPLCSFGLMIGLALLAAGSWRVGLLPKWVLTLWPPLGLVGSFLGIGPIPVAFVALLTAIAIMLPKRVEALR